MTLQKWVEKKVPGSGDLILQMDIEGAEYAVIMASSLDILTRFRILVIEFHNFDAIYDRYGLGLIDLAFQKLLQQFEIVHIHPNNIRPLINYAGYQAPPLVEFTFLRKDRILNQRPASMFPHVLDRANVPQNHDYPLPRCWFE